MSPASLPVSVIGRLPLQPAAAVQGLAVTIALAIVSASPAVAAASTDSSDRACERATTGARGYETFTDDGQAFSPVVWRRRGTSLVGVAASRSSGRLRLRVCTAATSQVEDSSSNRAQGRTDSVRSVGREIIIPNGERVDDVVVSDPWIVWVTRRSGQDGFRVRRRLVSGDHSAGRRFRGRFDAFTATTNGTTVLSAIDGRQQRIWQWLPNRRTSQLIAPRTVSTASTAPAARTPIEVALWDPDTAVLGAPLVDSYPPAFAPLAATQLIDTPRTRPCRDFGGSSLTSEEVTTSRLRATLTSSDSWSHAASFDGTDWSTTGSVDRLEACDPNTGRRLMAAPAGYSAEDDENGLVRIAIAGDALLASGGSASGYGSSGDVSSVLETGYVREGTATPASFTQVSGRNLATRAAAAWTQNNEVWVSDRVGTRAVAAVPPGFRGLRLFGRTLTIVGDVSSAFTVTPLAARDTDGLPSTSSTFNFGICSDQFSTFCPDPDSGLPKPPF